MKSFTQEIFLGEMRNDEQIAQLDPLSLDEFLLHKLPNLNRLGDSQAILEIAQKLTSPHSRNVLEAKAIVRDLGIIASSLVKHGISLAQVPNLETLFVKLAKITQEVPFKTVFSASTRNCQKDRMRTFTGDEQEKIFIRGLFKGMVNMPLCIHKLLELTNISIADPLFGDLMEKVRTDFSGMITGMIEVRKKVTPDFFTNTLHPYFLPIQMAGKTYAAESAAQMPILLVDRILWSAKTRNPQPATRNPQPATRNPHPAYAAYYTDNLQYSPLLYREISQELPSISIVERVAVEVKNQHNISDHSQRMILLKNLDSLEEIFLDLLKFRGPHRAAVEDNFQLRPVNSVGSGGYPVAMLDYLITETKNARKQVIALKQSVEAS